MNTLLLALLTDVAGLFYVVSAVIATQASTLWNFCFTELWVFSDRDHKRGRATRMALFFLMNNAALALRGPLLVLLTSGLGIHYVVSNVISLVGADPGPLRARRHLDLGEGAPADSPPGPYGYDIHGIVSVLSDARLPELERFRVGALAAEPDIRVRLGRVAANGDGPAIRYREGRLGFGLSIQMGTPIEATASPLVGRSPHVLYTNVVEPILRWTFAERGYALVHAACLATAGQRVPGHRPDRHGQDHHEPAAARPRGVLVPLRRPDTGDARTGGCSPIRSRSRSAGTR